MRPPLSASSLTPAWTSGVRTAGEVFGAHDTFLNKRKTCVAVVLWTCNLPFVIIKYILNLRGARLIDYRLVD